MSKRIKIAGFLMIGWLVDTTIIIIIIIIFNDNNDDSNQSNKKIDHRIIMVFSR